MKDSVAEEPIKLVNVTNNFITISRGRAASLPQRHRRKSSELAFVRDNGNITIKSDLKRSTSLSLPGNITKTESKSIGNGPKIDEKQTLEDKVEQTAGTDLKVVQLPTCSSQLALSDSTNRNDFESICSGDNSKSQEGLSLTESKNGYNVPLAPPIPKEWTEKLAQKSDMLQTLPCILDNHNSDVEKENEPPIPPSTPLLNQKSICFIPGEDEKDLIELELLNYCCHHDLLNNMPDSTSYDTEGMEWDDSSWEGELDCSVCYQMFSKSNEDELVFCQQCDIYVCKNCMTSHLQNMIMEGFIQISCPGDSCHRPIADKEVEKYCAPEQVTIYFKNKVDAENNPRRKTCPGCNKIHSFDDYEQIPQKIKCSGCHLDWCARCHAPWHSAMTCKKYQTDAVGKGKKALKVWAKSIGKDSANARKCPSCKFFIERISGCDHMSCSRCHTDFCYRCGKKHRYAGVLGDHYSRFSFLGCKYNLAPKRPFIRVAVRSSVLIGAVIGAPIAAALVVASGGILLGCSPILVPAFIISKHCC